MVVPLQTLKKKFLWCRDAPEIDSPQASDAEVHPPEQFLRRVNFILPIVVFSSVHQIKEGAAEARRPLGSFFLLSACMGGFFNNGCACSNFKEEIFSELLRTASSACQFFLVVVL